MVAIGKRDEEFNKRWQDVVNGFLGQTKDRV